jgi:hypothetical protein
MAPEFCELGPSLCSMICDRNLRANLSILPRTLAPQPPAGGPVIRFATLDELQTAQALLQQAA